MRGAATALAAASLLALGACSKAPETEKARNTQSLKDYIASPEGRRKAAAARLAALKGTETARITARRNYVVSLAEGRWNGKLKDGSRLKVSISRDRIVFMETLDDSGRTTNFSSGTVTFGRRTVSGTLNKPRRQLQPFATWSLEQTAGGTPAITGGGLSVPVTREKRITG